MSTNWLADDLWRAHVSWLTPPWVGESEEGRVAYNEIDWLDKLQRAHYRALIFYCKHHDGYCTFRSRYSATQPERDFLGECMAEARRRGMVVQAYLSSNLDQLTAQVHPDWQVRNRDGEPAAGWFSGIWPGAYLCINNPGYRDLLLGQCRELVHDYGADGLWLDVFSPHTSGNCFCEHCREKHTRETGGDLLATQDNAWYESCFVGLMGEIRAVAKGQSPDCVLGYNSGLRIPGVDALVDFQTHEAVDAPTISLMCRAMRTGPIPFETTYRLYSAVGSWAMRGEDRVLLETMATLAHGGACSIEVPPLPTGRLLDQPIARLERVGAYVRAREQYLLHTEPVYDAALLQHPSQYGWPRPAGWATVFAERDIPYAIVYPDADLSPYPLVVLDDAIAVDADLATRLAEHVRVGGSLLVECDAAQFGTPAGGILQEVLGLRDLGATHAAAGYTTDLDPRLATHMGLDDLVVEGEARRVASTTAQALAHFRYEVAPRAPGMNTLINLPPKATRSDDPAITVNHYGNGLAVYVACPLATGEIRAHRNRWDDAREFPLQLAANLARLALRPPLLAGTTPAGVEVVINAKPSCHVVHLLNHYVSGQFCDNRPGLLRLADVPVCVNESRIGRVTRALQVTDDGAEVGLEVERRGDWAEVRVAQLGAHAMVVFER